MLYEVCSKNEVNFKISRAMYTQFSSFFSYVGTLIPNVCSQFQQSSIFFICERHKGWKCLACVGDFLLSKKMD